MDGMVSVEIIRIQGRHLSWAGYPIMIGRWMSGLVIKLPETTHGQWLYWTYKVRDRVPGSLTSARKEEPQMEIEKAARDG